MKAGQKVLLDTWMVARLGAGAAVVDLVDIVLEYEP